MIFRFCIIRLINVHGILSSTNFAFNINDRRQKTLFQKLNIFFYNYSFKIETFYIFSKMILHSFIKQLIAKPTDYTILQQTTKIYYVRNIFLPHQCYEKNYISHFLTFVIGIFKKGTK